MDRGFDFLRRRYFEVLVPNLLVQLSDKLGTILDVIVVGFLIGSSQLPALNVVSPFILFSSIIYSLYGQGGSLLAIKAKSDLDDEKANEFFTLSIVGCLLACFLYMIFICVFADSILHILNIPADIFETSKIYLVIITNFFTLNAYIQVLSYFLKSDGRARLTLNAVLIANILNLCLDFVLINVFPQKIEGIAFALVIGYLVSAIYISRYYFEKDAAFRLISPLKFTLNDMYVFGKTSLFATPELVARIFIYLKNARIPRLLLSRG